VSADHYHKFITRMYRFRYQPMITPASVFDYDVLLREPTLLKQTPALGGYDSARYHSERFWATADDGTRVPISLICCTAER
jgi:oligopeptidase B